MKQKASFELLSILSTISSSIDIAIAAAKHQNFSIYVLNTFPYKNWNNKEQKRKSLSISVEGRSVERSHSQKNFTRTLQNFGRKNGSFGANFLPAS